MSLEVGYAQSVITPSLSRSVYLAGFGENRPAKSVHDNLFARALALKSGQVQLVLAALDLLGLPRAHCVEIEQRVNEKSPRTRLILASTHTHHGPDTIGFWGRDRMTSGVYPDFMTGLKDKVVGTILAALQQTRPADMIAASVRVPGVAKNARDPHIVDDELTCLQFNQPNGVPQVTLAIFPCHPEVLWEHNPFITADYPGCLRREIQKVTGAPCLFFSGALGGMMTPDVQEHSFEEANTMGKTLAWAGLNALRFPAATLGGSRPAMIQHSKGEIRVPLSNPLFRMAMEGGLIANTLTEEGEVVSEVNLIRLGPLWLATVPGELLPKLGLAIKAHLRQRGAKIAAVIGLANDELGYILPAEDFAYPDDPFDPGDHYEETMSVGAEIGPEVVNAIQNLSRQTQ